MEALFLMSLRHVFLSSVLVVGHAGLVGPDPYLATLSSHSSTGMETEIADQTFRFPSDEFARILSPKKPKHGVDFSKLLRIKHYDCDVDLDHFQDALNHVVKKLKRCSSPSGSAEALHYKPLASYLTDCVELCNEALVLQPKLSEEGPRDGIAISNSFLEAKWWIRLKVQLPSSRAL